MADIQIEVGLSTQKSYSEIKSGIKEIETRLQKSPIKIKAELLKGESKNLLKKDISDITKSLSKSPIKIKAELDKTSINNIAKQLRSALAVELKGVTGGSSKTNQSINNKSGGGTNHSSPAVLSYGTKSYDTAIKKINSEIGKLERASITFSKHKDGDASGDYNKLVANLKELNALRTRLISGSLTDSSFSREMSHINTSVTESVESLKTFDHQLKVHKAEIKETISNGKTFASTISKIDKAISQSKQNLKNWSAANNGDTKDNYEAIKARITELNGLKNSLINGDMSKEGVETKFNEIQKEIMADSNAIKEAGKNHKSFWGDVGSGISKLMSSITLAKFLMDSVRYMRMMFDEAVKIESAMNQIQIVTGASDKQMTNFLEKSIALAKDLGQSVSDVAASIETFTRLGYNMEDASTLSKYANIMSNVAATDIGTSTTGITSIIKGYQLDPKDAEHVADVLVKVGQDYAISAEELMAAFQRGGAALYASGTDFEKSAALFAATNASLQNAETTGTLWKSVSARIRSAKTELEEMGEDTSDLAEGFSKYREEIKALSGVDIMKDEHTFKDMYNIFVQLAQVWDGLQDTSQARIAEILGGKRNTSGIISTISNIQDAIGAYEKAMNSVNVATEANALYMDTTKAKIGELKASFQEFATDVVSSDLTKFAVGSLSNIIETVDHLVDKFGALSVTLAGIGIYKKIRDVFVAGKGAGGIEKFSDLTSSFLLASPKLDKAVTNMKDAISKSTGAFGKFTAGASAFIGSFSPISLAITSTIALIGGLALAINHANEKIKVQVEKARESGDAWNDSNSSIDNYKSRMEELRNQLNSGNLTEQESYKVKSELLSIQQSLTDSYGEQASGIDLVNGSLSTQISKLEQLKKIEAERYINENVEGNEHAYNEMTKSRRYSVGTYSKYMSDDAKGVIDNILSKLNAKYDGAFAQINGLEDLNIVFDGDATKAEQALNEFMTEVRNSSKELEDENLFDGILSSSSESLSKNKKVLEEYQDVYKNFLMAKITTDSSSYTGLNNISQTPSQWLGEYVSSVEKYNDALMSGDSSRITEARNEFETLDLIIKNLVGSSGMGLYQKLFEEIGVKLNSTTASVEKFKSSVNGISTSTVTERDIKLKRYTGLFENLQNEQRKISEWGLSEFGNAFDTSGRSFIQTLFGNVDMDKRKIITWSNELKDKFKEELASWGYDPELGSIDTVFGGSGRFGEDVLKHGIEIAFTPIMTLNGKTEFLGRDTINEYIESLVMESTDSGRFSYDKMLDLDRQGRMIGDKFVTGIIAAADEGLDYENNGNWAETVGRLMHFSGKFGAISLGYEEIKKAAEEANISTQEFIDSFLSSEDAAVKVKASADALKSLSLKDTDFINALQEDGFQTGEKEMIDLINAAKQAGVISDDSAESISYLASVLVDLGIISGKPADGIKETAVAIERLRGSVATFKTMQEVVTSALSSSRSATGLTKDEIDGVTNSFKELEDFDPYRLFEETANGVHLNNEELKRLNEEVANNKLELFAEQIDRIKERIYEQRAAGQDTSVLESELHTAKMLKSELEGALSSYNRLVNAASGGNERDSYENIGKQYEGLKETLNSGWYGDQTLNAYLDLLLSAEQRTGNAIDDFKKLDQTIAGTSHSLLDYWRYDKDGKLTSDGLFDFLDDVNKKLGDAYAKKNENGQYEFNFDGDKLKDVAESFGTTTEVIELFEKALVDAGMAVDLSKIDFKGQIEKAVSALKDLQKSGEIDSSIDLDFNVSDVSLKEISDYIETLKNERIKIDAEANPEAAAALDELIDKLETDYSFEFNLQTNDGLYEVASTIERLREITAAPISQEFRTENIEEIANLSQQLADLPQEVQIAIGIKPENISNAGSIVSQITENPQSISIPVSFNPDSSAGDKAVSDMEKKSVSDKEFTIGVNDKATPIIDKIWTKLLLMPKRQSIDIYETTHRSTVWDLPFRASGTAHANGTFMSMWHNYRETKAYANGRRWSLPRNENALVNELGTESIVRDGKWFTIGGGAHIENLKKGDIIFSAKQTEELIKTGHVTSGGGHGRIALANGTAFNMINAYDYGTHGNRRPSGTSISLADGGSKKKKKGSKSKSSSSDKAKEFEEIIDFIEIAIDRATEAFNRLAIVAESAFKTLTTRNKALNSEIENLTSRIELHTKAYDGYMAKANSIGLSEHWAKKVRDGSIEITTITDEDLSKKIKEYKDYYEKAIKVKDEIEQLNEDIAKIYQSKFENISKDFENQLELLEHMTNTYNQGIDDLEERGYLASTSYYKALQKVEQQNIEIQKKELSALVQAMSDAVNSGKIQEGSEAWYEMQSSINGVKESIQESETEIIKFQNAIREIEWDRFDYLQDRISSISSEADFLIDLLDSSKLFSDKGKFTDTGMATVGLHGQNYNIYMAQADKYAQEVKRLNAEIANDPNNTKLLERREELIEAQRESILAAEDEKMAIRDLVEEGIEIELEYLEKLIDKYLDALDTAKDLYDYQQKVEEQAADVAKLQKQLLAYSGDNSEEAKATIQKLQVELKDAQKDLEETQYDRFISEQKALLDQLYSEYELVLNSRLDNIDALISEMIDSVNANSSNIKDVLINQGDKVGYDISEAMNSIWSDSGQAGSIISKYGDSFTTLLTSVNNVLNGIAQSVMDMVHKSDSMSNNVIENTRPTTNPTAPPPKPPKPQETPAPPSPPASQSNGRSEVDYYGVALAIADGRYGWGNGRTRTNRLREKGFDSSRVQSIVNQLFREGHIRNGSWVGRYKGIRNLSPYHYNKYKNGGLIDYTGIAQVDGTPSNPEIVLNSKDSQNFMALRDVMKGISDKTNPLSLLFDEDASSKIMKNLSEVTSPKTNDNTNVGDITYHVNIPIEHVQDYNDFMNQMKKDGKFENMIRSMTVDQLSGGSRLSKNKFKW